MTVIHLGTAAVPLELAAFTAMLILSVPAGYVVAWAAERQNLIRRGRWCGACDSGWALVRRRSRCRCPDKCPYLLCGAADTGVMDAVDIELHTIIERERGRQ